MIVEPNAFYYASCMSEERAGNGVTTFSLSRAIICVVVTGTIPNVWLRGSYFKEASVRAKVTQVRALLMYGFRGTGSVRDVQMYA